MKKYLPSILPILTLVVTAVTPQVQVLVAHHPLLATILGTAVTVLNHWLPSPNQGVSK